MLKPLMTCRGIKDFLQRIARQVPVSCFKDSKRCLKVCITQELLSEDISFRMIHSEQQRQSLNLPGDRRFFEKGILSDTRSSIRVLRRSRRCVIRPNCYGG